MRCKKLTKFDIFDNRDRIRDRMMRWKYTFLGAGYYSAVFQHPRNPDRVIKLGPLDDGWLAYAAWCEAQRSSGNPHLPIIHSIRRYEKHGLFIAVMERLDQTVGNAMCSLSPPLTSFEQIRERFNYGLDIEGDHWCAVESVDWAKYLTANNLSEVFENTLSRLRKFAMKHGLGRDLHAQNAMIRKHPDGHIDVVITDPFSDGEAAKLDDALADARIAA